MNEYFDNNGEIISPSQTNWLNLLPDLGDKEVVKIASGKTDSLRAIHYFKPKSISCVYNTALKPKYPTINWYHSIDDLPLGAFDVAIVDEPEYLKAFTSLSDLKQFVINIFRILRSEGTLLLCFPNDHIMSIKYRYWMKIILRHSPFSSSCFFICDPSADHPLAIIPYMKESNALIACFPNNNEKPFTAKNRIRTLFKSIIFRAAKLYNPFRGLILIAAKSTDAAATNETLSQIVRTAFLTENATEPNYNNFFLAFLASRAKQFVFIYDRVNTELHSVVKIGVPSDNHWDRVQEEYQNLIALSHFKCLLNEVNIRVPAPLEFVSLPQKLIAAQTAVPGISADCVIKKFIHMKRREAVLDILSKLTNVQMNLQDICTRSATNSICCVDRRYFVNSRYLPLHQRTDYSYPHCDHIQHGDFAVINILKDPLTSKWGVIDWEWMARGYPPMFDLFLLFTSVQFTHDEYSSRNEPDKHFLSFIHTYFDRNWFSSHLKKSVDAYCQYFHFDKRLTFRYFTAFLLFQCNKYRLFYKLLPYQKLYEKMLKYSIENQNNFVLT